MKFKKFFVVILVLLMSAALSSCGNSSEKNDSDINQGQISENAELDFLWEDNYIVGFSLNGEQKTSIVIPEHCQGFKGQLFLTGNEMAEEITFEGDHDIDIQEQFCAVEKLRKIRLPAELTVIPKMAFARCPALEHIDIPETVTSIGIRAFERDTAMATISFAGDSLVTIDNYAFYGCTALSEVTLPDSVETIGESAFENCTNLKEFTLPTSIKVIGESAFVGSGLTDLYIPEEVVLDSIGYDAFVQPLEPITIHVVEGSWADEHFDELFDYSCTKSYT